MFEIRSGLKKINGETVDTFERDILHKTSYVEVEAGTTGFRGGERESGSRAYVRIEGKFADMICKSIEDGDGIEIAVCGDGEILALTEALHFASTALIEGCMEEDD